MINTEDRIILERIRQKTRSTLQNILGPEPQEIAYIDTPRHRNLGDSLIWAGAVRYLYELGHEIVYHVDHGRFQDRELARLPRSSFVLLHGGGNMGDLYPAHEAFRHHVIAAHPNMRFVMMPQSIHYASADREREAARVYASHRNVTLLVRESKSHDIALRSFPDLSTVFCPDTALGVDFTPSSSASADELLVLSREDSEISSSERVPDHIDPTDWACTAANRRAWNRSFMLGVAYRRLPAFIKKLSTPALMGANDRLRELNVDAAVEQFVGARVVVTNRLHAHILAVLLGIRHFVSDNSYGKISAVFNSYTGAFSTAELVESLQVGTKCGMSVLTEECKP